MMTTEQAQRLRVLIQEAFELVLAKPIAFVLVTQDQEGGIDITTNAARRELLPAILRNAADIVVTPPDGTIEMPGQPGPAPMPGKVLDLSGEDTTPIPDRPCVRKIEPDFTQTCPNKAAGGLKITLRPAESVEKRYGRKSLLTFVMDLPVCMDCLAKTQDVRAITDERLRGVLSQQAQQMNNGILPDWKRTVIALIPFDAIEYRALRKASASNDSQPPPSGGTT